MSEDKSAENDPERTLLTLEQLSQTIEVMSSVVNRLRKHLSEQLRAHSETAPTKTQEANHEAITETTVGVTPRSGQPSRASATDKNEKESFIVEIRPQKPTPTSKSSKTLH